MRVKIRPFLPVVALVAGIQGEGRMRGLYQGVGSHIPVTHLLMGEVDVARVAVVGNTLGVGHPMCARKKARFLVHPTERHTAAPVVARPLKNQRPSLPWSRAEIPPVSFTVLPKSCSFPLRPFAGMRLLVSCRMPPRASLPYSREAAPLMISACSLKKGSISRP